MANDTQARQGRIDLFNLYTMFVSPEQYSVYKRGVTEKGTEWFSAIGYYSTLDKAIKACKQDYTRREITKHENILSLDEAISIIVRANNHFESLIKNAFKGIET